MSYQKIIYLDHAAATPMDDFVLQSMMPFLTTEFYNPSSPYQPAVEVRRSFEAAKHQLAMCIGANQNEIIITAGATESINLAFGGVGGHVVTANIEHPSVLESAKKHANTIVEADNFGYIKPELVRQAIRPDTELISIALANNELGTIQPIREISAIVRELRLKRLEDGNARPIYFHCDASQGAGLVDINIARLGVDMLTLNSAKVYGPKQIGLLWLASYVNIKPQIVGGGQERGLRSGTENVAGAIGFATAFKMACEKRKSETNRLEKLRNSLQEKLIESFPSAIISGHKKSRLASHLHISFPGIDGERLVFLLEAKGVLVATGSACAANKGTRSHVLAAIGLSDIEISGSIRLSLGKLSNDENIKQAFEIIKEAVESEYERVRNV